MTLTRSSRMVSGRQWCLLALASLLLSGCNGSSGVSEYEQMKQKQAGFAEKIAAAGGSAKLEGRSMGIGQPEGSGWFIDLNGDKISDELVAAIIAEYANNPVF